MPSTFCPECDTQIQLSSSTREGDQVTCNSCGAYLKVTKLQPLELDWDDYGVDFDDDDDDFDDDDW